MKGYYTLFMTSIFYKSVCKNCTDCTTSQSVNSWCNSIEVHYKIIECNGNRYIYLPKINLNPIPKEDNRLEFKFVLTENTFPFWFGAGGAIELL